MSSFSLTPSPNSSRQGRSDPGRIAPFLTNVVTHHGQLTLIPPQNAGRIRKGGKKGLDRARTDRRREAEEPRFNTAAPASPRTASRRVNHSERNPRTPPSVPPRFSRDTMIPDYPPPSFQEAMMTPPFIPPPPVENQESQAPETSAVDPPSAQEARNVELHISTSLPSTSASSSPATGVAQAPSASPEPLTLHTEITPDADRESPHSQGNAGHSSSGSDTGSEDSSIELLNLDADGYHQDQRIHGQLRCRANRIHRRQHHKDPPHGVQTPRHVSRLSIDADDAHGRCSRCGSPTPEDCTEPHSDQPCPLPGTCSPPSSPKSSKWKRLFVPTSSHNTEPVPMSPMASSPKSPRFGFLPAALASTLTLSAPSTPSPSKPFANPIHHVQRKEPSVMRRIFSPKGKEREAHVAPNPRDSVDWEFIDDKELPPVTEDGPVEEQCSDRVSGHICTSTSPNLPRASELEERASRSKMKTHSPTRAPVETPRDIADHPAFINRAVRHPPLTLNPFPMFSANSSVVSLPLAATAHEQSKPMHVTSLARTAIGDPGQIGSSSLARRQTLSTSHASPSVVWLPLITSDDGSVAVAGSPVPALPSPMFGPPRRMPSRLSHDGAPASPIHMRTPSTPSPLSHGAGRPPQVVTSPLAFSVTPDYDPEEQSPSPTFTESPGQDSPQDTSSLMRAPTLRSPASTSTLASTNTYHSSSSPTTPTRHYHGRPLPQLPGPSLPFERVGHTPLFRPTFLPEQPNQSSYPQMSDLDVFAAQVVDDDHDGRRYEDLLRIAEMAGPAVSPTVHDEDALPLPPSGRVRVQRRRVTKDGRVKLKLILMDTYVDKCSICLSQFREAEVACLGTKCPHAFHEYCLKRWVATRRSCPLCRAEI